MGSSAGVSKYPGIATAFKEDGEDVFMGFPDTHRIDPKLALAINQQKVNAQMEPPDIDTSDPAVDAALQAADLQDEGLIGHDSDTSFQGENIWPGITDADLLRSDIAAATQGGGTWPYADLLHSEMIAGFDGEGGNEEVPDANFAHPEIAAPLQTKETNAESQETGSRHFDIAADLQEGVNTDSTDTDPVHCPIAANYPSPITESDLAHAEIAARSPEGTGDVQSPITDTDLLHADLAAFQEGAKDTWSGFSDEEVAQSVLDEAFPEDRHTIGSGAPEVESRPPKQDESIKEEGGDQYFQGLTEAESSGNPD